MTWVLALDELMRDVRETACPMPAALARLRSARALTAGILELDTRRAAEQVSALLHRLKHGAWPPLTDLELRWLLQERVCAALMFAWRMKLGGLPVPGGAECFLRGIALRAWRETRHSAALDRGRERFSPPLPPDHFPPGWMK